MTLRAIASRTSSCDGGAAAAVAGSAAAAVAAVIAAALPACTDPCCTIESTPIALVPLDQAPEAGGLRAMARDETGRVITLAIDTGTPLTTFSARPGEGRRTVRRSFDLLDANPLPDGRHPTRGNIRGVEVIPLALGAVDGIVGCGFLSNFSVAFRSRTPTLTFWARQGATDAFFATAEFAVFHFNLFGGGELLDVHGEDDFFGLSGPVEVPPTRIVLRACAAPAPFDIEAPQPEACCTRGDEVRLATGSNLSLVVATGVGPLVLSRSAWARMFTAPGAELTPPAPGPPLVLPAESAPFADVAWSTLPRLALVDQEANDATNPGACVELGRARRLTWAEHHLEEGVCVQPCDTDPKERGKAQNAAAYVEVSDAVPVAIVPDSAPFLQGLRAEVRPEGPEIDGLLGTAALRALVLEIDYRSQPARAIVTCERDEQGEPLATCRTSPRCPRREQPGQERSCFGEPRRPLPATCEVLGCE